MCLATDSTTLSTTTTSTQTNSAVRFSTTSSRGSTVRLLQENQQHKDYKEIFRYTIVKDAEEACNF